MPRQLTEAIAKKKNHFICQILSDITLEKEGPLLLNKNLVIRILALKIYQPNQFKEIKGGHSNETFYCESEKIVLRFPKTYNPLYPELSIETQNLLQAQLLKLTPLKTVAYYSKYSLLITEFVPNYQTLSADDFKNPERLITLAHLVKKLHYSQCDFKKNTETGLSFIDESSKCFQTIKPILNKKDYLILKKLSGIKNFLEKSHYAKFPAHGDLHHYNVIETNGTMQLIDWELSSVEDPAYDISRLFCITGFNSEQKNLFLTVYKNSFDIILSELDIKNLVKRIFLHESLNYFSIVIWAKYTIPFFSEQKQKLLIETIENFSAKDKLIRY